MNQEESKTDADPVADRIRRGDQTAEDEFVEIYARRVKSQVIGRLQDAVVAEDLTQETLLAVLLAMRGGRLSAAEKLPSFVRGVARNLCNKHLRELLRRPTGDWKEARTSGQDPERRCQVRELLYLVGRSLANLDSTDQMILQWSLEEGLTSEEIGIRLGIRAETARQRKCRALQKIRSKSRTRPVKLNQVCRDG